MKRRHKGLRSSVDEKVVQEWRRRRSPRALTVCLTVTGHIFVLIAVGYAVLDRRDLPSFLPHALGASVDDGTNDLAIGAVMLTFAGLAYSGARYAKLHRSWMRTKGWHRKHGRV